MLDHISTTPTPETLSVSAARPLTKQNLSPPLKCTNKHLAFLYDCSEKSGNTIKEGYRHGKATGPDSVMAMQLSIAAKRRTEVNHEAHGTDQDSRPP
jgi:hypothetical protein